jgi:succinate dehydrogenase / fumarate reductase, cytochrome b subunit
MDRGNRPLSPHIQIYRLQITSVLSILHRGCGIALAAGLPFLVWWLIAAASGPADYALAMGFFGSIPGRLLLLALSFSFFYHLANGVRHLAWDAGLGFELPRVHATGWAVVIASLGLTALAWVAAYAVRGG